jgi:hypothetical protein
MSVPNTPASLDEATCKKGERVIIDHGTRKVRGELCRPFQAIVLEVLKNVVTRKGTVQIAHEVQGCDIPRRTSVVAHVNVFELRQCMATPISGEQRVSVRDLSATTRAKKRLQKSLKAEVSWQARYDDRRLMREEVRQREAAINATWERRAKKFSRAIRVREEEFSAVKVRHKLEVEALEKN